MNLKSTIVLFSIIIFLGSGSSIFSQTISPDRVIEPVAFDISKKLSDVEPIQPIFRDRSWKEDVVPNKDGFREEFNSPSSFTGPDPALQKEYGSNRSTPTIGANFSGVNNLQGVAPPDTDGDVGLTHYMQMVNSSFEIFDKIGNSVYGPADNSTLWDGFNGPWTGTNDGDPIVLYDEYADRWIASQFALPNYPSGPFYELIAVSASGDPTGSWYRYAYEFTNMPDYPKFGVWPDGYYFTINQFTSNSLRFAGGGVCVVDRDAMINGIPNAAAVLFTTNYGSLLPADADGSVEPQTGSPAYMLSLETNHLRMWEVSVDWNNVSNSTMTYTTSLYMDSYSYSGFSINQPGTSQTLDPLSTRLMYRLQYRNFGSYEVLLTNHTVNDGSSHAGLRWYELRDEGSGWYIYQQGTFAQSDGDHRWMGSIAMNGNGDIALGYSVSGSSTYPSIRFAGQTAANSGNGILDVIETSILEGSKSQTGVNRWGDYSMMSVDPSDDQTFWYTTEYSGGGWSWKTQIASFSFDPPVVQDPIANFTATPNPVMEGMTVQFTDISENNPTSWSWSFTGGDPATSTDQNPVVTYPGPAGFYDVGLTVSNSTGNPHTKSETNYIEVIPYTITYCESFGSNSASEWIDQIDLGSYNNPSSNNGGYGNYLSETISLESGQSYSFSGTPGFANRSKREFWRVWIDFNADGNFDASEEVFGADARKGNVSGTISIPSGLTGETRMRVSMKYNSVPGSCEQFSFGEVEDYTILFGTPPPEPLSANFEGNPTIVVENNDISFTDLSTGSPTSWSWTFQDGSNTYYSSEQNPTITYTVIGGPYLVSLMVSDDLGSDPSTKTINEYITVVQQGTSSYCASTSTNNDYEYISNVNIDGSSNGSGASFYSDFTGITFNMTPGSTSAVTLTPAYLQGIQREFWRIWIDFNGDGDFEDADETVFVANNKRNVVSGSIDIPSYASGQTRMRITMKNGGSPSYCGTFERGEVEDYTVDFGPAAPSRRIVAQNLELKLYPNPAHNVLNVEITSLQERVNIKVYNALGVILDNFNTSDKKEQIDLSNYNDGIYYIGVEDDQQTTLEKFIKQ